MTLIHDNDANPITAENPLPVMQGFDASDSFDVTVTSPDATSAQVIRAATSGEIIYVTDVVISTSAAKNVRLEDTDGTAVMFPIYLGANGTFNHSFKTPLQLVEGKGLNYKASASGVVTVTVTGFVY